MCSEERLLMCLQADDSCFLHPLCAADARGQVGLFKCGKVELVQEEGRQCVQKVSRRQVWQGDPYFQNLQNAMCLNSVFYFALWHLPVRLHYTIWHHSFCEDEQMVEGMYVCVRHISFLLSLLRPNPWMCRIHLLP